MMTILSTFKQMSFKLNNKSIRRVIKHYEIKKKQELDSSTKDYICNILDSIPLYKESRSHLFYFWFHFHYLCFEISSAQSFPLY